MAVCGPRQPFVGCGGRFCGARRPFVGRPFVCRSGRLWASAAVCGPRRLIRELRRLFVSRGGRLWAEAAVCKPRWPFVHAAAVCKPRWPFR